MVMTSYLKGLKVSSSANFLIRTKPGKSRAIPVTGPQGYRRLRLPDFEIIGT